MSGGSGYNLAPGSAGKGVAVTAVVGKTASAPAALTAAAAAGANPTKAEFDKTVADQVAMRTTIAALVVDMTNSRTFEVALQTSLHNGGVIA